MAGYFSGEDGFCLRDSFSDALRFKIMSFFLVSFRIFNAEWSFAVKVHKAINTIDNKEVRFTFFNIVYIESTESQLKVYYKS